MTLDSDDLEEQLRENLKLRRTLAAEVAKAKQGGGIAYRLGWLLYWMCLALAVAWIVIFFWSGGDWGSNIDAIMAFSIPVIILYGLGRAFRYVLSGA